jgi:hypothetical protein
MHPQDESPRERSNEAKGSPLPDMDFLKDLPRLEEMEDEEFALWTQRFAEKVRLYSGLLREQGMDPEQLRAQVDVYKAALREADVAQEASLHATADKADAERKAVDQFEAMVAAAEEKNPFHPQTQKWKEELQELRKQYPKID